MTNLNCTTISWHLRKQVAVIVCPMQAPPTLFCKPARRYKKKVFSTQKRLAKYKRMLQIAFFYLSRALFCN